MSKANKETIMALEEEFVPVKMVAASLAVIRKTSET